jgi:hypothetical protein
VTGLPRTISKPTLADKQGAREQRAWVRRAVAIGRTFDLRIIGATSALDADRADFLNTIDERGGCGAWAESGEPALALQLRFLRGSESMGNHDSKIVDAGSVD